MSGRVTGWALANGPKDPMAKLVLIAIADAANHFGENARPGMKALTEMTGLSDRYVQKIIARLIAEQFIELVELGGGRGKATVYRLLMDENPEQQEFGVSTATESENGSKTPNKPRTNPEQPPPLTCGDADTTNNQQHKPPPGEASNELASCQELVAFYVDVCRKAGRDPTARQRGAVAKQVQRLVSEGKDRRVLRRAIGRMAKENKPLSLIDFVVGDVEEELFVKEGRRAAYV